MLGIFISVAVVFIAIFGFLFNSRNNLIFLLICLELILLAIGLLLIHLSFNFDDLIGATLTLYLLPLAGAESAIGLALMVVYYPTRGTLAFNSSLLYSLLFDSFILKTYYKPLGLIIKDFML